MIDTMVRLFSMEKKDQSKEEAKWVMQTLSGDLNAFNELMTRYQPMAIRILYRYCPQEEELKDLVQDCMLKLYRNLSKWKPEAPFQTWAYRLISNCGYDYIRAQRRLKRYHWKENIEAHQFHLTDESVDGIKMQDRSDSMEWVNHLMRHLKPKEQALLTMYYYEDLSMEEIADLMNWSLSKTKVMAHRARKKLKEILSNERKEI